MVSFVYLQGGSLELVKEIFKEVKPGLSSYADTPIEVNTYHIYLAVGQGFPLSRMTTNR